MVDEDTLKRWFATEGRSLNEGLVRSPRLLSELLAEDDPTVPLKGEGVHRFDPEVLERWSEQVSPLVRASLKLPITFYHSHETPQDCYVMDKHAIKALVQLELVKTEPRDDKLWIGAPLARRLAREHPTIFQFCRV